MIDRIWQNCSSLVLIICWSLVVVIDRKWSNGFDHWLRRLNANGKFAPLWFWSLAHLWLWWLTASGKMSLLGIPWMKQNSFDKSGVQESQTSMSNEYVPVSNAGNCVCSIECCACRYVFMLQWTNLAKGGVESFWCTVLDHFNLNFKTQQSHCQRAKPGFFFTFSCAFRKSFFWPTRRAAWSSWLTRSTGPKAFRLGPKKQLLSPKTFKPTQISTRL